MLSLPPVPKDINQIPTWLTHVVILIEGAINNPESPHVIFQELNIEPAPETRRNGMHVYADGTNWNPGSGRGLYRWEGAAWNFVG